MTDPVQADAADRATAAEVNAAFEDYEAALLRHDVVALNEFFVHRDDTVRYGVAEENYGFEAIAAWRRTAQPVSPQRRIRRLVIATYGRDTACVSCEFSDPSIAAPGRQSQLWVRTA